MSLLLFWGGNIPFDMVIWYGVNQMNIHFFKASIPSSSLYSIHPFLQHHPGGNYPVQLYELNHFPSPNSSDDLCLVFCLYPSSMTEFKVSSVVTVKVNTWLLAQ